MVGRMDIITTLRIDAGREYRTRDGHRARVREIIGGGDPTILGELLEPVAGVWFKREWSISGCSPAFPGLDLVAEWSAQPARPDVPWDKLPPEIRWVAMDLAGRWCGYPVEPIKTDAIWRGGNWRLYPSHSPQWSGNWQDSLVKRP